MLFTGPELTDVLGRTGKEIELRNEYGRCCRLISRGEALALDPELFVGIGNLRRIRFLRARSCHGVLNAGSHTTQRIKDGFGIVIAPPLIKEHRPIPGANK